jgi:hypothetical protein
VATDTLDRRFFEICKRMRVVVAVGASQFGVGIHQRESCLAVIEFLINGFLAIMAGKAVHPILFCMGGHKSRVNLAVTISAITVFKRLIVLYMAGLADKLGTIRELFM